MKLFLCGFVGLAAGLLAGLTVVSMTDGAKMTRLEARAQEAERQASTLTEDLGRERAEFTAKLAAAAAEAGDQEKRLVAQDARLDELMAAGETIEATARRALHKLQFVDAPKVAAQAPKIASLGINLDMLRAVLSPFGELRLEKTYDGFRSFLIRGDHHFLLVGADDDLAMICVDLSLASIRSDDVGDEEHDAFRWMERAKHLTSPDLELAWELPSRIQQSAACSASLRRWCTGYCTPPRSPSAGLTPIA